MLSDITKALFNIVMIAILIVSVFTFTMFCYVGFLDVMAFRESLPISHDMHEACKDYEN